MKFWIPIFLGILFILGMIACKTNELPAATPAGFINPEVSLTPSKTPTNQAVQIEIPATATHVSTISPNPTASPTPKLPTPQVCKETTGRIEERELESEFFDAPLSYSVYLPPCYAEQSERRYPALYLFHGQSYSNQHWIDLGAASVADRLITTGELAPFIMVFPYDRNHNKPPTTNPFGEAVIYELIPAIDQGYRTDPRPESRAIGGISRGGNWAAHLSLQHPTLFGAVGLHSTPIFSTDTNQEIIHWLEAIPVDILPRIYIDSGQNDRWLAYTLIFEELLNDASIPHEWHLYPGYHEDPYWEAHLEQYIRWYASPWSILNR